MWLALALLVAKTLIIPAASAKYRATVIREAHAQGGLNAPVAMFAGQLTQESRFNPTAHSGAGAQGLAQFMPATAQWLTTVAPKDFPTADSLDPQWSIRALIFYDYWLYARCPQYVTTGENRWASALASYNGGLGYVLAGCEKGSMQRVVWLCRECERWADGRESGAECRLPSENYQAV